MGYSKPAKIVINLYANTMKEQVRLFLTAVSHIVPKLLTAKPKYVGREGGGLQGKNRKKDEAYWTIERE